MSDDIDPPLNIARMYVLRLRDDNELGIGRLQGQLEHVVTGRRRYFASPEGLLMALALEAGLPLQLEELAP